MLDRKDVIPSPFDARDFVIRADNAIPFNYSCPIKVPIKDQGSKPTCVAHALSSLVEYHHRRQHQEYKTFSTEFIYGNRTDGDFVGDGMVIKHAIKKLQKCGDCYESDCWGNSDYKEAMTRINDNYDKYLELAYPHRISTYYRCNTNEQIKTALVKHGPVVASMNTYDDAKIKNDTYTTKCEGASGRHCVLIYGYDERGWLVQNSWGLLYGGDGRFVLPYDFKLNEAWGVTDDIYDKDVRKKSNNKISNWIYKILNVIINWVIQFTDRT